MTNSGITFLPSMMMMKTMRLCGAGKLAAGLTHAINSGHIRKGNDSDVCGLFLNPPHLECTSTGRVPSAALHMHTSSASHWKTRPDGSVDASAGNNPEESPITGKTYILYDISVYF